VCATSGFFRTQNTLSHKKYFLLSILQEAIIRYLYHQHQVSSFCGYNSLTASQHPEAFNLPFFPALIANMKTAQSFNRFLDAQNRMMTGGKRNVRRGRQDDNKRNPQPTGHHHHHPPHSSQVELLSKKLQSMIDIERHHIISISNYDGDDIDLFRTWIDWCPRYEVVPGGRARGGQSLLHHRCRHCRRVCFHLLERGKDQNVRQRICLSCWDLCCDEKLIPEWYYHRETGCLHCADATTAQPRPDVKTLSRPTRSSANMIRK
jgi:hypothetical protein